MKYRNYYFLLFICICSFSFFKVNSYTFPLQDKIIYIDPGHGGVDSGATYKDILEKDINLELSYLLKSHLENKGAIVYMTRYDDYDLASIGASLRKRSDLLNRAKVINDSNADLYVSIHLNSSTSSKWNGIQIFYDDINPKNYKIAKSIQDVFKGKRNVSKISDKYLYKRVNIPGVLVELGFLSNSTDREKLMDNEQREILIKKVVDGLINYYK